MRSPSFAEPGSSPEAFTLLELLIIIAIIAVLGALIYPSLSRSGQRAEMARTTALMRSVGVAMNLYSSDHANLFVGPLWPGQVAEYDRAREGRLVRELASYLEIEDKSPPYVVKRFLSPLAARALPGVAPKDIRAFVMNMAVGPAAENPWGSLAAQPASAPMSRAALQAGGSEWAMSEAYQTHPRVVSAAWRMNTPPAPLYGKRPLGLFFDGRVDFFNP